MNNGVFVRSGWPLVERKMKEMLVSVQLESRYTKAEILTLYANQINLGHGAYGVEAAARHVLRQVGEGPDARGGRDDRRDHPDAGAPQSLREPRPHAGPAQQLRAAAHGRGRLHHRESRPPKRAEPAARRCGDSRTPERSIAPYFVEDIRKMLEQKYGAEALYETGLRVQTTLDVDLQGAANARRRPRPARRRQAARRLPQAARNIVAEGQHARRSSRTERWSQPILAGDIVPAVVTSVPGADGGSARSASATTTSSCTRAAFAVDAARHRRASSSRSAT